MTDDYSEQITSIRNDLAKLSAIFQPPAAELKKIAPNSPLIKAANMLADIEARLANIQFWHDHTMKMRGGQTAQPARTVADVLESLGVRQ